MKLNERTLDCLTRLRGPDFKPYVDYLKALRSEIVEALVKTDNHEYKARLSGQAVLLREMLDNIEHSQEIMKKLSNAVR